MIKNSFFIIILFLTFLSCKTDNVNGIIIGDTLFLHQSFEENMEMKKLIKGSLKKDYLALIKLKNFPNGGAASSYDLGYVISQIVYKIGEDEFVKLVKQFPDEEKKFQGLIDVGLEYGDNDYDGVMDDKKFEQEFPKLYEYVNGK